MSDRQISIRLGKGFWSRVPHPSVFARGQLLFSQPQGPGLDDLSLLFQAHLDLTQHFSNAHDILYSSTSRREDLYIGGEYVRYIVRECWSKVGELLLTLVKDDFTYALRQWKLAWGNL